MAKRITFDEASEYLRLTLPIMSKHRVPTVPLNYSVWFEHTSGGCQALSDAIKRLVDAGEEIDEDATRQLYSQYLDPTNRTRIETAERTVRNLVAALTESLDKAGSEVSRYEQSLQSCAERLSDDIPIEQLRPLVSNLIESTHQMEEGSAALHQHLDDSKRDANALRDELERVRTEAKTDPLTGLANRRGFEEQFEVLKATDDYAEARHSLLIGDIDHFKNVNDNYGHLFGDKILKVVGTAFSNLTKGKDLAARFGGEEFIVLLPKTDVGGAVALANSIRKAIENGRVVNPKTGEEVNRITISLGVTELVHGEDLNSSIARADEALYAAKGNGRNRVEANAPTSVRMAANQ